MTTFYSNTFDDRFGWACQLLIDGLLLLTFLLAALPETLLPQTSVSGVQFCMFAYFPAAALLLLRWAGSWTNIRVPLLALMLAGVWMAVVGFFSLKDVLASKSFAGDVIMYSGVICGFIWADRFDPGSVIRRLRIGCVVTLVLTFATIVGLQIGALTSWEAITAYLFTRCIGLAGS